VTRTFVLPPAATRQCTSRGVKEELSRGVWELEREGVLAPKNTKRSILFSLLALTIARPGLAGLSTYRRQAMFRTFHDPFRVLL